jgi:hypothetical protein
MSKLQLTVATEDDSDLNKGDKNFVDDLQIILEEKGFAVERGEEACNAIDLIVSL